MTSPRWLKRLGASLLIGGQAVTATLRGRIDRVELFDGRGHAWPAEVRELARGQVELELLGDDSGDGVEAGQAPTATQSTLTIAAPGCGGVAKQPRRLGTQSKSHHGRTKY